MIVEVGGTVGDIESLPFLEAIRQFRHDVGRENAIFVHLTLLPYIAAAGELKTKPTQHSVRELMQIGIQPDILIVRTERPISDDIKRKIALFCNVEFGAVIESPDVRTIYEIPLRFHEQGFDEKVLQKFGIERPAPDSRRVARARAARARAARARAHRRRRQVHRLRRQLQERAGSAHPRRHRQRRRRRHPVDVERGLLDPSAPRRSFAASTACSCPADSACAASREWSRPSARRARRGLPFFGICLGMQTAIIEFARNVCGLDDSHSSEFAPECDNPVISLMESQQHVTDMGGTMRLGAYPCRLARGSQAAEIYGQAEVSERHRHRYEVSNKYRDLFVQHGMRLSGLSPDGSLVEIVELTNHPWFIGCQFHPELQSRPTRPHPLFAGFIAAAAKAKRRRAARAGLGVARRGRRLNVADPLSAVMRSS